MNVCLVVFEKNDCYLQQLYPLKIFKRNVFSILKGKSG